MNIILSANYQKMLSHFIDENVSLLAEFNGKTILLTGVTGMIGSFFVDVFMKRNISQPEEEKTHIIGISRNAKTLEERFSPWAPYSELHLISCDVSKEIPTISRVPDYYIHAASTTHPIAYASEPVNTVLSNVFGINNLLQYMIQQRKGRLLLLSSVEIYGTNRGDTEFFDESYCGYIDCNTLRAGYPEAKRLSEALCQAYIKEYSADVVTIRLPRIYGATMRLSDSKAAAQFILNGVLGEDIVLKSEGTQYFSYANVYDAVNGILLTLLKGTCGEAYNLGDPDSDVQLRDFAKLIADYCGKKVIFQLPNAIEKAGFSTATVARLDGEKLKNLGFVPHYDIDSGIRETIEILKDCMSFS